MLEVLEGLKQLKQLKQIFKKPAIIVMRTIRQSKGKVISPSKILKAKQFTNSY